MLDLIEQNRAELERPCACHSVERLELFGSAASGDPSRRQRPRFPRSEFRRLDAARSGGRLYSACCMGWKTCFGCESTWSRIRPSRIRGLRVPSIVNGLFFMPHDPRKLLEDIQQAALRIQQFTANSNLEQYAQDILLRAPRSSANSKLRPRRSTDF